MSYIDVDAIYLFYNMTQCEFIDKLKKVHGDKYDYSLTYIGNKEKIIRQQQYARYMENF